MRPGVGTAVAKFVVVGATVTVTDGKGVDVANVDVARGVAVGIMGAVDVAVAVGVNAAAAVTVG